MTGAWVGKARCLSLWKTINTYVTTYIDIHSISLDTPWVKRWMNLVDQHRILEKRDFEFLAFVIAGDPEATVLQCINTIIDLIPNLSEHLIIEFTNNNGNVQYRYIPLNPPIQSVAKLTDDNRFSHLQSDTESEEPAADTDDIADHSQSPSKRSPEPSDIIDQTPIPSSGTGILNKDNVYQSALRTATSTLDAISDASKDIQPTAKLQNEFNYIYDATIDKLRIECNERITTHTATLKLLHDEYFDHFCQKCDNYCKNLSDDFDKAIQQKFNEYDTKIKSFEDKIIKLNTSITQIQKMNAYPSPTRSQSTTKSKRTPQKTYPHTFGPTRQSPSPNMDNTLIPQYFQKTSLEFWHQADRYFLLDKDYIKNSPKLEPPTHVNDALSLYSQIQKNALIYNIFVSPIDDVKIWDYSPNTAPTTCNLDIDDTATYRQVYQRSAVALYTKIQTVDMKHVPIFKQLLIHERSSQDGYKVLYAMLCGCHPRLVEKTKLEPPKFHTNGNLFTFIREYSNYIECERISKRNYTDIEKLSFVIEALEADGRFEKALTSIKLRKSTYEEVLHINDTATFPPALTLETLPYTIMQCYTPQEKSDFFSTPTTNTIATVNTFERRRSHQGGSGQRNNQRRMIAQICPCCGIAGHDANHTGCDFAASFIMTNAFLRNNTSIKHSILTKFKQHQKTRLINLNKRMSLSNRIQNNAKEKRIGLSPQMKLLMDAIGEEIEADLEIDTTMLDDPDDQIFSVYALDEPNSDEFHDTSDTNTDTIQE